MSASVKRQYDTANRQRQAAATQLRILDAARALFLRDGYTATTMTAIAAEAGVAVQTVYASTRSKREILKRILDLAVSGEDEQVPVVRSARWRELDREPDPVRKLAQFARLHTEICRRESEPFAIMAEAAGSDPEVRTLIRETARRRYQDQRALARSLRAQDALRSGLTETRAADIIWTLASERTYLALVHDRHWSVDDYADWLTGQLTAALLPGR